MGKTLRVGDRKEKRRDFDMHRIIKSMEDKYLIPSLDMVERTRRKCA